MYSARDHDRKPSKSPLPTGAGVVRTRAELDVLLAALESDLPRLMQDMDAFHRRFEDRVEELQFRERPEDGDYVFERLQDMLRRASIITAA